MNAGRATCIALALIVLVAYVSTQCRVEHVKRRLSTVYCTGGQLPIQRNNRTVACQTRH